MDYEALKQHFLSTFGGGPEGIRAFFAPGRVNLIGEHVDYNGGPVMPAAIGMGTTLFIRPRSDGKIFMKATDLNEVAEANSQNLAAGKNLAWGAYQLGVLHAMAREGIPVGGADMLYHDTLPHGGGLSSSAAIEVATALAAHALWGPKEPADKVRLALLAQKAENEFVGVNCGIMDQFASAMGRENCAVLLNCQTLAYRYVPLKLEGVRLVIANTNKKRGLADSKYNQRRTECDAGLAALQTVLSVNALAQVTPEALKEHESVISDETVKKRVRHVVMECHRVEMAAEALEKGDLAGFGALMNESGDSLKDLYEVTGPELDALVSAARRAPGVLGARMTGAGFGGCTVNLVREENVDEFLRHVGGAYEKTTGLAASFYITGACGGCREL